MRKRRDLGQPSDIAFLLIIFFLLLTGIATDHAFSLSLSKQQESTESVQEQVTLTVAENGTIQIANQTISLNDLPSFIIQASHLTLQINKATPWQSVVDLLATITQYSEATYSMEMIR